MGQGRDLQRVGEAAADVKTIGPCGLMIVSVDTYELRESELDWEPLSSLFSMISCFQRVSEGLDLKIRSGSLSLTEIC